MELPLETVDALVNWLAGPLRGRLCDTVCVYLVMISPCALAWKIQNGFGTVLLVNTNINLPGFCKLLQCRKNSLHHNFCVAVAWMLISL